eukprot:gene14076-18888_t
MSSLNEKQKYQVYQEQQEFFKKFVELTMDRNTQAVLDLLTSFLTKHSDLVIQDIIANFNSDGKNLLHIIVSSGNFILFDEITRQLKKSLGNNSDLLLLLNKEDNRGFTLIMNATISESTKIMESLLQSGVDVNARNHDGASAANFAAGDGSIERLQLLHNYGASLNYMSKSGTPLHWAAGKGRSDAVKFLIDKQVDLNVVSPEGLPAVVMAAVASCDEGVKELVDAGADIGLLLSGNLTTLHICAENGLFHAVESIIQTVTGKTCVNTETNDGNKPIHLAAMSGHKRIIELLVNNTKGILNNVNDRYENLSVDQQKILMEELLNDGKRRLEHWNENNNPASKRDDDTNNVPQFSQQVDEAKAEEYKNLGNNYYLQKDYTQALVFYSKAIESNPSNATYWSNRSACHLANKDPINALKDAEICRKVNPMWPKGAYRLAMARFALKQYEDAAVAAFEGCKLDDTNKELKQLLKDAVKKGQEEHQKTINSNNS